MFIDAFVKNYLEYEAGYTWVVEKDQQVVGYLTGCKDTSFRQSRYISGTFKPVVKNVLRGRYHLGWKIWRFACSMLLAAMRQEFPKADYASYPAHLHINIDADSRGQGWDKRLIETYLDQLRNQGIPGVHLNTTNKN